MRKMMVIIGAVIVLLISFQKCDSSSLGDNYYYRDEFEAMDVGDSDAQYIYRGDKRGGYTHITDVVIFPDVINYQYESKYIVAIQKPDKKRLTENIRDELRIFNDFYNTEKKDSLVDLSFGKYHLSEMQNIVGK